MVIKQAKRQELVNMFDPNLKFIDMLDDHNPRTIVHKVNSDGNQYVMKICSTKKYGINHARDEALVLRKTSGITRIPKLIREYENINGLYALLKEYVLGKILSDSGEVITDINFKDQLSSQINAFHGLGFADLDIRLDNVILSEKGDYVTLFDFGSASHPGLCSEDYWQILKQKDLWNLKQICSSKLW